MQNAGGKLKVNGIKKVTNGSNTSRTVQRTVQQKITLVFMLFSNLYHYITL